MTAADWPWILAGIVGGLALCLVADAIELGRLRADVDFLMTVSGQNLTRSDRNG